MDKTTKFAEYILEEIIKDYRLNGAMDRLDIEAVKDQAFTIACELIKNHPSVSVSSLEIGVPLARERSGKITYNNIVKAFNSEEYQIKVKEIKDEERKNQRALGYQKEEPASRLWKSICTMVYDKYLPKLSESREYDRVYARRQLFEHWESLRDSLRSKIDTIEQLALSQGFKDTDEYKGDV